MNNKLKSPALDQLFEAILLLKTQKECYNFFEDICTVSELKALGQRLEVALMLEKDCKYDEIVNKTGASTATIARVKRCLDYGSDGYKVIITRFLDKEKGEKNEK